MRRANLSPRKRGSNRHSVNLNLKSFFVAAFLLLNSLSFSQKSIIADSIKHCESPDIRLFRSVYDDSTDFKTALAFHFDNSLLPMSIMMPIAEYTYGRIYDKTFDENTGYLLAFSEATNIAVTFGVKQIVKRKRPYSSLSGVRQKDLSTHDPYSFPSGHSSGSFTIATMFALRYPKYPQAYVPMYIWSLIVIYGRPYLGMHYPSDVLGGALIGAGSSILIYSLSSELFRLKNDVLKETKNDEGSINGGVASVFAGSLVISDLLNTYLLRNNRITFGISPNGMSLGIRF